MREQPKDLTSSRRRLWFLLSAPCGACLLFSVGVALDAGGFSWSWLELLRLSAASYACFLAMGLLMERGYYGYADGIRFAEVSVAIGGLSVSTFLFLLWFSSNTLPDLRFGAFGAVASLAVLTPQRTDRLRALAFALMSVAKMDYPLASLHPPFVSIGMLSAAAALMCLVKTSGTRTMIGYASLRKFVAGVVLIVAGIYGLGLVHEGRLATGWYVIFGVGTVYFAAALVLAITRGDGARHS